VKELLKQLSGLIGTGFAASCCLGLPLALSALGATGLSFLAKDAYLFPFFTGFLMLTLWLLFRSSGRNGNRTPFWLGLVGSLIASVAMWLLMTGIKPLLFPVYIGIGLLIIATVWDFINGRKSTVCASKESKTDDKPVDLSRRAVNGAALSVAAAGAFYGMYKSVDIYGPKAEVGDIACYGANSCKGTTACSTADNACTGQNSCKGKGWINLSATECKVRGGQPLKGSSGDPAT
jgi:hypothetical protein